MSERTAWLLQLDDAWGHEWESLRSALEGVSEAEGCWQAPCYASETPEAGWPPPGTIAWQVAHLAHCKRYYTAVYPALDAPSPPVGTRSAAFVDFATEREALEAAHVAQRAAIAATADADMGRLAGGKVPLRRFLAMTIRHDTWHAGQIAVVRRLYRTRGEDGTA